MSDRIKELYRQLKLPVLQNRVYNTRQEALDCPTGDMCLVQNLKTGLIYNKDFRPDLVVYDESYQNEQGFSNHFQKHLNKVMDLVETGMGKDRLVEVGCGKGAFLEMLLAQGFDVTGFDPTYEGSNPKVRKHFFEKGVGIQADGLILRHVLEHIPDPVSFLQNLAEANHNKGRIYIEVPCFDWICKHKTWFDVFYEHVNYFRLTDFHRIFENIVSSGYIFGGQYLYVVADLSSVKVPKIGSDSIVTFPSDFTNTLNNQGEQIEFANVIVWGAASKGVIFSLLKARAGQSVSRVIDINPVKQGKYLPLTGLQVESPESALPKIPQGSTIYVMNSNYLNEVIEMSKNKYNYTTIDHE